MTKITMTVTFIENLGTRHCSKTLHTSCPLDSFNKEESGSWDSYSQPVDKETELREVK